MPLQFPCRCEATSRLGRAVKQKWVFEVDETRIRSIGKLQFPESPMQCSPADAEFLCRLRPVAAALI